MREGLRFFLTVDGKDDLFTVVRFTGEEKVSAFFAFTVETLADSPSLAPEQFVGKDATLLVRSHDGTREHRYHGLVSAFTQTHATPDGSLYSLVVSPHLWPFDQTEDNQIILSPGQDLDDPGMPAVEALGKAMQDAGAPSAFYTFSGIQTRLPRKYICQYRESHVAFCERWMEYLGASYYFDHADGKDVLKALDTPSWPGGGALPFQEISGLPGNAHEAVYSFQESMRQIPARLRIKDYNPDTPDLVIEADAEISPNGKGLVYIYDDDPRTQDEAVFFATRRAEAYRASEYEYAGRATRTGIRPGYMYSLTDHPRSSLNRTYLVTGVRHDASQAAELVEMLPPRDSDEKNESYYRCEFTCVKGDVVYRPLRSRPWPQIIGTLNAKIDAAGSGEYAELNTQGRYKVIMPFDQSGRGSARASCYMRMAQPYAGDRNGMHFPLTKGTEVLIAFTDGDPDRPYIHAAIPNLDTPSPTMQANQTQLVILSLCQNIIRVEDQEGLEHIHFHNPATGTTLQIGNNIMPGELPDPFQGKGKEKVMGIFMTSREDYAQEISLGRFEEVGGDRLLRVHEGDYINNVTGNRKDTTTGKYTQAVDGEKKSTYKYSFSNTVGGNKIQEVGGAKTIMTSGNYSETIKSYKYQTITGILSINAKDSKEESEEYYIHANSAIEYVKSKYFFVKSNTTIESATTLIDRNMIDIKADSQYRTEQYSMNILHENHRDSASVDSQTKQSYLKFDMNWISHAYRHNSLQINGLKAEVLGMKGSFALIDIKLREMTQIVSPNQEHFFLYKVEI